MLKQTLSGWFAGLVLLCAATPALSQTPPPADATRNEGIPVQSDLVRARCGTCHRSDDKGRMSRISYRRTTPEDWEQTIKRMVTLNHANLDPADARGILKYLADHQGLAPEEDRPIAFDVERRMIEYSYTADKDAADNCSSCHSIGRVTRQRRTKEEWELLVAMHRGYYPLVDTQPMNGGRDGGARGRCRPSRGRTADHPTTAIRWTRRSRTSKKTLSVDHARVVGVVGDDAVAEARRALGARGLRRRARDRSSAR